MEYCSGGDLSRFIQSKQKLPESIARKFLQQLGKKNYLGPFSICHRSSQDCMLNHFTTFPVALALQFLHSKGIAHMDLKPQNLLLTSKENPRLKLAGIN